MHPVLEIPEILQNIFSQLEDDAWQDGARILALFSAAQTCRSFVEPALDALWYEISGIYPLLKAMGDITWSSDREVRIIRPIRAENVALLRKYSRRVRVFYDDPNGFRLGHPSVNNEAWPILYAAAGGGLFPNIRQLCVHLSTPGDLSKLPLLCSPSLKRLDVLNSEGSRQLGMYLSTFLANMAPQEHTSLTRLRCSMRLSRTVTGALVTSIEELQSITTLEVQEIPPYCIPYLSRLRSIRKLVLIGAPPEFSDSESEWDPEDEPGHDLWKDEMANHSTIGGFPALERVAIEECEDLTSSFALLKHLPPNMQLLSFALETSAMGPVSDDDHWVDLLEYLSRKVDHESLQLVRILGRSDDGYMNRYTRVRGETLQSLQVFHSLTSLDCYAEQGFDLDDDFLQGFAKALPGLKILHLTCGELASNETRNTLMGLSAFAEYCSDLRILSMTFDARPPIPTPYTPPVVQRRLDTLCVDRSLINNSKQVLGFLSTTFRRLSAVEANADDEKQEKKWNAVGRALSRR